MTYDAAGAIHHIDADRIVFQGKETIYLAVLRILVSLRIHDFQIDLNARLLLIFLRLFLQAGTDIVDKGILAPVQRYTDTDALFSAGFAALHPFKEVCPLPEVPAPSECFFRFFSSFYTPSRIFNQSGTASSHISSSAAHPSLYSRIPMKAGFSPALFNRLHCFLTAK